MSARPQGADREADLALLLQRVCFGLAFLVYFWADGK